MGRKIESALQWAHTASTRKGCRGDLPAAWQRLAGWNVLEPARSRLPLAEPGVDDIASQLTAGTPNLAVEMNQLFGVFPARDQVFPAWQGMQYLHNMFDGRAPSGPVDNGRYDVAWTDLREVLADRP